MASAAPAQTLFVYQPTQFVIWGGNRSGLALGQDYTFWGSQWAKQVTGGEYGAGNSFKGYASKATGDSWTTRPGDASAPPASIASYIGVLVSDNIVKSGSVISGDVTKLVVLHVENPSAYQGDPGHSVAGEFVAVIS